MMTNVYAATPTEQQAVQYPSFPSKGPDRRWRKLLLACFFTLLLFRFPALAQEGLLDDRL